MSEHVELVINGGPKKRSIRQRPPLVKQPTHELKEIVMGGDQDPFNKEELVHTLKGRELCLFVVFYAFAVTMIVLMFECLKPVLFNPNYPE